MLSQRLREMIENTLQQSAPPSQQQVEKKIKPSVSTRDGKATPTLSNGVLSQVEMNALMEENKRLKAELACKNDIIVNSDKLSKDIKATVPTSTSTPSSTPTNDKEAMKKESEKTNVDIQTKKEADALRKEMETLERKAKSLQEKNEELQKIVALQSDGRRNGERQLSTPDVDSVPIPKLKLLEAKITDYEQGSVTLRAKLSGAEALLLAKEKEVEDLKRMLAARDTAPVTNNGKLETTTVVKTNMNDKLPVVESEEAKPITLSRETLSIFNKESITDVKEHVMSPTTSSPVHKPVDNSSPLPPGWEIRYTDHGRIYYADRINKKTTWQDPRLTIAASTIQANNINLASTLSPKRPISEGGGSKDGLHSARKERHKTNVTNPVRKDKKSEGTNIDKEGKNDKWAIPRK